MSIALVMQAIRALKPLQPTVDGYAVKHVAKALRRERSEAVLIHALTGK